MLKDIRTSKNKTLAEVAQMMNISTGYLSHLERGIRPMSDELISRMAKALDVSVRAIREEAEKTNSQNALNKTWLSKIMINGNPLFDAFRYNVMARPGVDTKNERTVSQGLVSFVAENIAQSIIAELEKNRKVVPTLMAQLEN